MAFTEGFTDYEKMMFCIDMGYVIPAGVYARCIAHEAMKLIREFKLLNKAYK